MTNIDVKLIKNNQENYYDIGFDDTGDLLLDDSFDTAIVLSLFTDARASSTQVAEPERRNGWFGNTYLFPDLPEHQLGSKIWLISGRKTQRALNEATDFSKKALQYLITDGYLKRVEASSEFSQTNNFGIVINITFVRKDDSVETRNYELWNNTEFDI